MNKLSNIRKFAVWYGSLMGGKVRPTCTSCKPVPIFRLVMSINKVSMSNYKIKS